MRVKFRRMIAASRAGLAAINIHYLLVSGSLAIRMMVTIAATICVLAMLLFIMMVLVTMVLTIVMVTRMV